MCSELSKIETDTKALICDKKAFTLLEVLIALAILSFGILGVAQMQISAIRGNADAIKRSEILIAAQKQVEEMMQEQYDTFVDGEEETLGHSDYDTIPQDYTLKYVVTTVGECKKIEVTLSPITVYENRVQPTANIIFLKAKNFK